MFALLKLSIVPTFATLGVYLATADSLNDAAPIWMPLLNSGAFGICLAWFMLRGEKHLRAQSVAINLNTQALMVAVLACKNLDNVGVKELAERIRDQAHEQLSKTGNETTPLGR